MPSLSFVGDITTSASSTTITMSAEPAPVQRISPLQSLDDVLKEKDVGHAKKVNSTERQATEEPPHSLKDSVAGEAEDKTKEETALLAEVSRTWTAGKSSHQTSRAKAAFKRALQYGFKPREVAKYVVQELASRNQPSAGEEDRVRKFAYNTNKELKKDKKKTQAASQPVVATKTTDAEQSLVDEHTNDTELISEGSNDVNKKRKASELEQSSLKENKKMDAESMNQERHCMEMWLRAKAELKKLREELKEEKDAEVLAELTMDIECLKRKKDEWATLLGMKEEVPN